MLTMPINASPIAAMIGIDPGSSALGLSILKFDIRTGRIVSTDARTYRGEKYIKHSWLAETHGERTARIYAVEDIMVEVFNQIDPYHIVSESPFFNSRFPAAYGALKEVMSSIVRAVIRHDNWKTLHLVEPTVVKQGVGWKGKADKDEMKRLVNLLPDLCYQGTVPLLELDEHSIDALAVVYTHFNRYMRITCQA